MMADLNGGLQTHETDSDRLAALEKRADAHDASDAKMVERLDRIEAFQHEESAKTAAFRDKLIAAIPSKAVLHTVLVFVVVVLAKQCGVEAPALPFHP